jgi:hypothetical protein
MKTTNIHLVILFVILSSSSAFSQKLSKFYSSWPQESGTLYFIKPNEDFSGQKEKSKLTFDLTYLQGNDSVVFNFSTFTPEPQIIDSVCFITGEVRSSFSVSKLFVDFQKKQWQNRYSAKVPFETFSNFIHASHSPELIMISKGAKHNYVTKQGKWQKYAGALTKIIYIIESNQ